MSEFLFRLGRRCARHPFRVLGLWLVGAVALVAWQGHVGGEFKDNFRVPGVESQKAADVLASRFPTRSGTTGRIVFHADHRLDDPATEPAIEQARAQLASGHDVVAVTDPFDPRGPTVSADGRTAYLDVQYSVQVLKAEHLADATSAVAHSRAAGVRTELTGSIAGAGQKPQGKEMLGIAVAVVVLLVAFGSAIAMGIPIGTALFGIGVGAVGMKVLAGFADVPTVSEMLGMMIGLGVGIDYALFVVTRYRQHLHEGASVADAAGTANATAGQAVLFAGGTVVIAILGLQLAGLPAITMMGLATAIVVAVAMVAAVTLLPALLGLAGTKIDRLSIHRKSHVAKPAAETLSGRWAHHVGRHPVRYAIASFAVLCAIALPVLHMRIGMADDGNAAPATTERKAYDLLADAFGKGFNGPIHVVLETPTPGDHSAAARLHDALAADPGVAAVTPAQFNQQGDTAILLVEPKTSPQDAATDALVRHLRHDVLPAATSGTTARATLTGRAMVTDLTERIASRLPWFIGAVVALSFVLLMIVFRSVLVPLKAAAMNLLSIAAAYGVIVAIFQWGWGKNIVGLEHTIPVNPFVPMIMFAILFGLSMDYEVFLLSRIREEFVRTGDSHTSVVDGLSSTARVITSAALIMISVFGAFILGDDVTIKMFGVGLSVAVLLDATLVRLVLVPATMSLLGSANWWLPRWLDRILPNLDLEGGRTGAEGHVHPLPDLEPVREAA
jgi:RND superfamily putative drug exporter